MLYCACLCYIDSYLDLNVPEYSRVIRHEIDSIKAITVRNWNKWFI